MEISGYKVILSSCMLKKKKVSLKFWVLCITHSSLSCKHVLVNQLNFGVENLNVSKPTMNHPVTTFFTGFVQTLIS